MKIKDEPDPSTTDPALHDIEWSYQYEYPDPDADAWKNKKTPRFLHQDATDEKSMYLLGRHFGKASVMRFDKSEATLDWRLEVTDGDDTTPTAAMTDILAYVQPKGQKHLYACGFAFVTAEPESTATRAVMFKVSDRGKVQFMYSWGEEGAD